MTTRNNAHARAGIDAALGDIEGKMAGHTPGPWTLTSQRTIKGADGSLVAMGNHVEADNLLICAAPDLLACLEESHRLLDQYLSGALVVYPSAIRHQSRAAIAKAKAVQS